jgi:hypothetical protein
MSYTVTVYKVCGSRTKLLFTEPHETSKEAHAHATVLTMTTVPDRIEVREGDELVISYVKDAASGMYQVGF